MAIENFTINISDDFIEDLSARLKNTRWTNGRVSLQWDMAQTKRI